MERILSTFYINKITKRVVLFTLSFEQIIFSVFGIFSETRHHDFFFKTVKKNCKS